MPIVMARNWWGVVYGSVCFVVLALAACRGGSSSVKAEDATVTAPNAVVDEAGRFLDAGAQVYRTNCQTCHGPTGKGDGPNNKVHNRPKVFASLDLNAIRTAIRDGVDDTRMIPFGDKLSRDEVLQVAMYVAYLARENIAPDREDRAKITKSGELAASISYPLQQFHPKEIVIPASIDELKPVVTKAFTEGRKIRVMGSRHSYNTAIVSSDLLISLKSFKNIELDPSGTVVRVGAGVTVAELQKFLVTKDKQIWGPPYEENVTVVGAFTTGSHGAHGTFGALYQSVTKLTVMTTAGEVVEIQDPAQLSAFRVSLGTLGIILDATLLVHDGTPMKQTVSCMDIEHLAQTHATYTKAFSYQIQLHTSVDIGCVVLMEPVAKVGTAESSLHESELGRWIEAGADFWTDTAERHPEAFLQLSERLKLRELHQRLRATFFIHKQEESPFKQPAVSPWLDGVDTLGGWQEDILEIELIIPEAHFATALRRLRDLGLGGEKQILPNMETRYIGQAKNAKAFLGQNTSGGIYYVSLETFVPYKEATEALIRYSNVVTKDIPASVHLGKGQFFARPPLDIIPAADLEAFLEMRKRFDPKNQLINQYVSDLFCKTAARQASKSPNWDFCNQP
jgi:FAD/FMN-containing dehydrogenase